MDYIIDSEMSDDSNSSHKSILNYLTEKDLQEIES